MSEMERVVPVAPVFAIVNTWVAVVVTALATRTLPKLALGGVTVIAGAAGAAPVPVAVKVPSAVLAASLAVIVQLLSPVEVGVNCTVTVREPPLPLPTFSGTVVVTWNSLQPAAVRSNVTIATVPGLLLTVVVAVWDCPTATGLAVSAACATPLPPIHTMKNNSQGQRFDMK
jgi:hypothetical protein